MFTLTVLSLFLYLQPLAFGRHLLRNYKSYSSANWHKHSPISEDVHETFCLPPGKTTLPPEATKPQKCGVLVHISEAA